MYYQLNKFFSSTVGFDLEISLIYFIGVGEDGKEEWKRESELLLYQTKVKCHQVKLYRIDILCSHTTKVSQDRQCTDSNALSTLSATQKEGV